MVAKLLDVVVNSVSIKSVDVLTKPVGVTVKSVDALIKSVYVLVK